VAGRAELAGKKTILNNQSPMDGLDYVTKTGTIVEAIENQAAVFMPATASDAARE